MRDDERRRGVAVDRREAVDGIARVDRYGNPTCGDDRQNGDDGFDPVLDHHGDRRTVGSLGSYRGRDTVDRGQQVSVRELAAVVADRNVLRKCARDDAERFAE